MCGLHYSRRVYAMSICHESQPRLVCNSLIICCKLLCFLGQDVNVPCCVAQVIDDVANMGFSRHEVRGVINQLMDAGQAVDLNIVLDRLMRAHRG